MKDCRPGAQCCPVLEDRDLMIESALQASAYAALRDVCCCVEGDHIVVCGSVPSFYLKQVAQCLLLQRFGTSHRIENRLAVIDRAAKSVRSGIERP